MSDLSSRPQHTEYRAIVEPFFQRAKDPTMIVQVEVEQEANYQRSLGYDVLNVRLSPATSGV